MAFAITANFLLGTYQGSDSGGRPEPYPSPDRLYKACVAAAYNTFDFERQTDDRVLTDEQIKNALAWLEDNPPHSILLPRVIPPTSDAISYRDKGYLEKGKVKKSPDKASKAMSYCQNAVESLLLTWQWDENPNQEVINTLKGKAEKLDTIYSSVILAMRNISIDDINAAILNGGAGSLLVRVELEPASGLDGIIAPAKYAGANNATYVYEKRYLGEEKPQKVVLIDSKGSFANRVEETITEARRTGEGLLASMPHIVVKYDDESGSKTYCDSQLPHRGFDGHIRVGVHDGKSTSEAKEYIDARNSTLENLLPLFELSPVTVLFGGWDSTRSKNQLRIPSVLTGEMYGVLADQSDDDPAIHRAGARIDPVGASVSVAKKADREKIVGDSIDLSENTKNKFIGSGKGSIIGLGAIPPSADKGALDGVSVRGIVSSRVLSFTMLRTFHFGKGVEGDAAIRALIAAALLRAMAGYDENPVVRANCALTETGKPSVVLNKRYGEKEEFEPLTAECSALRNVWCVPAQTVAAPACEYRRQFRSKNYYTTFLSKEQSVYG